MNLDMVHDKLKRKIHLDTKYEATATKGWAAKTKEAKDVTK